MGHLLFTGVLPALKPQLSISPNNSCWIYHLPLHFPISRTWEGRLNNHNNSFWYHVSEATSFHPYRFPKSEAALQRMSGYGVQLGSEAPRLKREQLVLSVQESPALLPCRASLIPKHDFFPRQNHTTCSLQISTWLFNLYFSASDHQATPSTLGLSVILNPITINKRNTLLFFWFCGPFF